MRDFMTLPRLLAPVFAFALAAGVIAGPGMAQQGVPPPPGVVVVTVKKSDVDLSTTLPGRVVASAEAEVRPQVAGIITERLFDEGGHVEEGDVLYRIDPASYDAAVAQAQAAVAQAQAQIKATEREAERLQTLSSRNVVSEQSLDSAIAARDGAAASLQAAEAQLKSAEIEQDRTVIRARLSGEIGRSVVSPGALVTASQQQPLATIRNIDPIYVDVTQSAADLLAFRRGQGILQLEEGAQHVRLTLADGSDFGETGKLTAAEPVVDPLTGVVVLRITFANPDKLLLPGMYVQAEMPAGVARGAILVPHEGVSRNRRGQPTALVVGEDNVVEQRVLSVLQDRGAFWVVSEGLQDGDRVVVEGLKSAAPGATVTPEERTEKAAEPAATDEGDMPASDAGPEDAAPKDAPPESEAESAPDADPGALTDESAETPTE